MEWSRALEGGRPLGSLNTPSNRVRTPANGPGITGRFSVLRPSCWACVTLTSWASGKGRPTSCNSSPFCSILGSLKESPLPPLGWLWTLAVGLGECMEYLPMRTAWWGQKKSQRMGPRVRSHYMPKTASHPANGKMNKSVRKTTPCNLTFTSLLHPGLATSWPLATWTVIPSWGCGWIPNEAANLVSTKLWVLPELMRTITLWKWMTPTIRMVFGLGVPVMAFSVSPMASIRLYCKYFDDNKLYLVALMYLLQVW